MAKRLDGQVAIVTGARSGIGTARVPARAEDGASIVVNRRAGGGAGRGGNPRHHREGGPTGRPVDAQAGHSDEGAPARTPRPDRGEKKVKRLVPYGRTGDGADLGRPAILLASDASDDVVDTTLVVDGGGTLRPGFSDNG